MSVNSPGKSLEEARDASAQHVAGGQLPQLDPALRQSFGSRPALPESLYATWRRRLGGDWFRKNPDESDTDTIKGREKTIPGSDSQLAN